MHPESATPSAPKLPWIRNEADLPRPLPTLAEIENATTVFACLYDRKLRRTVLVHDVFVVKYGQLVHENEGHALLFLEDHPAIPTPKLFAMYRHGDALYIIMEYIPGQQLSEVWPSLSESEKLSLTSQLRQATDHLRAIPSPGTFSGVFGGPLQDRLFFSYEKETRVTGPFATEAELSAGLALSLVRHWESYGRHGFATDFFTRHTPHTLHGHASVLTHADFQRKNILVIQDDSRPAPSPSPVADETHPDVVKETPPDAVKETPPDVAKQTPSNIAIKTPSNVANETASIVADEIAPDVADETVSNVVGETLPDNAHETRPNVVDETHPDIAQETLCDVAHETHPSVVDKTLSDVAHQIPSDVADETLSDVASKTLPDVTQETRPDVVDEILSNPAHKTPSDVTDKVHPDVTDDTPSDVIEQKETPAPRSFRLAAIIDWESAGWYPSYWGFACCFAYFTWDDDWPQKVERIFDPCVNEAVFLRLVAQQLDPWC